MLRVLLLSPDDEAGRMLRELLQQHNGVVLQQSVDYHLDSATLLKLLRSCAPECVFLSAHSRQQFLDTLRLIETEMPGLPVVAFGPPATGELLQQLLRIGIREYLHPLGAPVVHAALERVAERRLKTKPQACSTDHLYTFLPAKAGVGASTIALQVSITLANQMKLPTLLMDCDLGAGLQQWLLKLDNSYSLADAVGRSLELDDQLWPQLVAGKGLLDLLAAGPLKPSLHIDPVELRRLLAFARRKYRMICADLSGNLERYSVELMAESKRVFLVTTPELPALYLASEKLRFLRDQDLGDKTQLLLNRTSKGDLVSPAQVEKVVGLPVAMSFANSYREVNRAAIEGDTLPFDSPLGKQLSALARTIQDPASAPPQGPVTAPARRRWSAWLAGPARVPGGS